MSNELKINPGLPKYAREECGYSELGIANKIHVDQEQYSVWEDTNTSLSLDDLVTSLKICKRQIAFFLPNIPSRTKKPTDFRSPEPAQAKLTDKTLLAIRRTVGLRDFLQLYGREYYKDKYF